MTALQFRTPHINQKTKLYRSLRRHADVVLQGRLLVLDPSCGSLSSRPGYAIYDAGELRESGVIEMPTEARLERRLYYLARVLREQFTEKFDVVVVEDIPALRFSKFGRSLQSQISLHYAVGVIFSSFDVQLHLRVFPATWRAYAPETLLEDKARGVSTDEQDAQCMGEAVLQFAKHAKLAGQKPKRERRK